MNRSHSAARHRSPHRDQNRAQTRAQNRAQRGLTLIECVVTLAIIVITLGAAIPTFTQARERRHLEGAAAQLATDIHHARSLAVSHGAPVRLRVQQASDGSCYVVHTGSAGDCQCTGAGTSSCRGSGQALRTVGFERGGPVRLASNSASMLFDADRGTVTPTGTLSLQLPSGATIRQIVNIMGRVRSCSPGAAVVGYVAC